jgi:glucose-1-phosphatase
VVSFVVFDVGDVVCRFDPDSRLQALEHLTGRSAVDIHQAIWGSGLDHRADRGEIDAAALPARLAAALEVDVDTAALRAAWALAFPPNGAVVDLIDRLAVRAVLFSNNGPMLGFCLDLELASVRARFVGAFLSWELRAMKPEPAAYEAVRARLAVDAGALFFVDDSPANVVAARALGWHAEVFTDVTTLERQLAALGALESA